jgi:hypothetical protein
MLTKRQWQGFKRSGATSAWKFKLTLPINANSFAFVAIARTLPFKILNAKHEARSHETLHVSRIETLDQARLPPDAATKARRRIA